MRALLYNLDRIAGEGDKAKRGLAVLRSFVGALKLSVAKRTLVPLTAEGKANPTMSFGSDPMAANHDDPTVTPTADRMVELKL